jgi:hypothetical protein
MDDWFFYWYGDRLENQAVRDVIEIDLIKNQE